MNLNKLVLKNFFSYKDSTIDFSKDGIYIIYGQNLQTGSNNGVGKSTIKEAIQYALYGKCRVSSLDEIIKFGNNEATVELYFEAKEKKMMIRRGRIRGKKTYLQLFVNGKEKTQNSLRLTDELIVRILGIDYDKFMHSFCFGQSPYDDLKQLTTAKLIEFLKSVLNLERFNKYLDKVKELKEKNNAKINKLLGIKESYSQIVDVDIPKKQLEKEAIKLYKENEKLKNKRNKLKKEYLNIQEKLDNVSNILHEETNKILRVKKQLDYISKNETCPTCKQKLKNNQVEIDLTKEFNKISSKINKKNEEKDLLTERYNKFYEELSNLEEAMDEENIKIIELETKIKMSNRSKINIEEIEKDYRKAITGRSVLVSLTDIFNSKGLPLFILNNYIPKLEFLVNEILSRVTDFKLQLTTTKELKSKETRNTCEIKLTKGNRIYPLENLSNGEEFLITLAFRIGISKLYKNETKFETLILDECFGSLGNVNKRKVLLLLNSLEKDFKKILIISHVEEIRNWRKPYKIQIEKDRDTSKIKEDK